MKYVKKACNVFFWILDKLSRKKFKRVYPKYLRWLGIKIENCKSTWINPNCFFDSYNYGLTEIGKGVVISTGVTILVHDASIRNAMSYVWGGTAYVPLRSLIERKVMIGNNVFIGANTTILPGSVIEDNCIVGAGTVVRGRLESGYVYYGNPCQKICSVEHFAKKYDYLRI